MRKGGSRMIKTTIKVDMSEIDRISIGARLYDMLDAGNENNRLRVKDGNVVIFEKDIAEMFRLVNPFWEKQNVRVGTC